MAQDRVQLQALVNTVMNPWIILKVGKFLICEHWHLKNNSSP